MKLAGLSCWLGRLGEGLAGLGGWLGEGRRPRPLAFNFRNHPPASLPKGHTSRKGARLETGSCTDRRVRRRERPLVAPPRPTPEVLPRRASQKPTGITARDPMYSPAVRSQEDFVDLAVSGLASMYPTSAWSALCSRPAPSLPIWSTIRKRSSVERASRSSLATTTTSPASMVTTSAPSPRRHSTRRPADPPDSSGNGREKSERADPVEPVRAHRQSARFRPASPVVGSNRDQPHTH